MNETLGFQKNAGVNINAWKVSALRPLTDNVIVIDMNFGEQVSSGGIILQSDNGKAHGDVGHVVLRSKMMKVRKLLEKLTQNVC